MMYMLSYIKEYNLLDEPELVYLYIIYTFSRFCLVGFLLHTYDNTKNYTYNALVYFIN